MSLTNTSKSYYNIISITDMHINVEKLTLKCDIRIESLLKFIEITIYQLRERRLPLIRAAFDVEGFKVRY